jgi:thioredoxin-related protein
MKTMIGILLICSLVNQPWLTDWNQAQNKATQENKFILLNFSGSDWCAPCIKMKKEVFESEAFLFIAENELILVRADFPRSKKNQLPKEQIAHNEKLAEKYNASGKFPLTLLIDAKGKVVKEWDGYAFASQDKFLTELRNTLTKH